MKMTYDPEVDALYIRLREGRFECMNVRVSEDVAFDIGPEGVIVGIEVLDATRTLGIDGPIRIDADGVQLPARIGTAA